MRGAWLIVVAACAGGSAKPGPTTPPAVSANLEPEGPAPSEAQHATGSDHGDSSTAPTVGGASNAGTFAPLSSAGDVSETDSGGLLGSDATSVPRGNGGNGLMRTHNSPIPTTRISAGTVDGSLDAQLVRKQLKRNLSRLQWCYEKQLAAHPDLAGTVTARFTVAPDGKVTAASASGVAEAVSSCIVDIVKTIEFPSPSTTDVKATYSFTFSSTAPSK